MSAAQRRQYTSVLTQSASLLKFSAMHPHTRRSQTYNSLGDLTHAPSRGSTRSHGGTHPLYMTLHAFHFPRTYTPPLNC